MSSPVFREADLTTCDREPIHIPGSVQPHGVLFALSGPENTVTYASENCAVLAGQPAAGLIGRPLIDALTNANGKLLSQRLQTLPLSTAPASVMSFETGELCWSALVHRNSDDLVVLELEKDSVDGRSLPVDLYGFIPGFISGLQERSGTGDLARFAATELRALTGFDRVLIYRFDENWNGTVIAEDRNDRLPSYLDLRFPASDIPAQARELYRLNRVRLIPDASYDPVPILSKSDRPLNLQHSTLRSVSPLHLEYMRNMETAASMSISILREGQLWGLISCHHAEPRYAGFPLRTCCDLAAQILSMQLAAREHASRFEARIRRKETHAHLLAAMAREEDFIQGLIGNSDELLQLADATGAAVLFAGKCFLVGETPSEEEARALADWLTDLDVQGVWSTDSLPGQFPGSEQFGGVASGLLAISVSRLYRSFVLWFRREMIRTVSWGGDPRKPAEAGETQGRIHPRKSFEVWKETVRGRSIPWDQPDLEAATDFRDSFVGIVLRKAEELAEMNEELERSNKELEAFSYSVSHDLRAPFRHIVGYSELLHELEHEKLSPTGLRYISTILESARYAGTLVDNLLMFSQIARSSLVRVPVDMNVIVRECIRQLHPEIGDRDLTWNIPTLPTAGGDPALLRLAMLNLLSNAVKYTRRAEKPTVEVGGFREGPEMIYFVRDNGVGFEMAYADKLFGVFQRLHRMEDFEGTGIGLANVRRIIARHGGRTWADGKVNQGATFWFSLPIRGEAI